MIILLISSKNATAFLSWQWSLRSILFKLYKTLYQCDWFLRMNVVINPYPISSNFSSFLNTLSNSASIVIFILWYIYRIVIIYDIILQIIKKITFLLLAPLLYFIKNKKLQKKIKNFQSHVFIKFFSYDLHQIYNFKR